MQGRCDKIRSEGGNAGMRAAIVLGLALAASEKYPASLAALQNAATVSSNRPFVLAELGRVNALAGNEKEARDLLDGFEAASAENYISPINRAKVHLGLGEIDKVFESLNKGFEEHSVRMPYFIIDPQCDSIRSDERFKRMREDMGISRRGITR